MRTCMLSRRNANLHTCLRTSRDILFPPFLQPSNPCYGRLQERYIESPGRMHVWPMVKMGRQAPVAATRAQRAPKISSPTDDTDRVSPHLGGTEHLMEAGATQMR